MLLGASSCKKDVLRWTEARRVEGVPAVRWNRIVVANDSLYIVAGGEKFERADGLISRDGGMSWEHRNFLEIGKGLYGLDATLDGGLLACGFKGTLLIGDAGASNLRTEGLPEERFYVACAILPNAHRVLISTVTFETGTILLLDADNRVVKDHAFKLGLNDMDFADAQTGYVAGYGAILRTADGGMTWGYTTAKDDHFVSLDVHTRDTVYACGNTGSILRTTDGGEHWEKLRTADRFSQPFYALQDVLFTDTQHGYAVGEDGLVIFTDDAGEHWSEFERFTTAHLRSIALLPNGVLLVCGDGGALWRLKAR